MEVSVWITVAVIIQLINSHSILYMGVKWGLERDLAPSRHRRAIQNGERHRGIISEPYATGIRAGKRRPHPRHWLALAQLVAVSADQADIR